MSRPEATSDGLTCPDVSEGGTLVSGTANFDFTTDDTLYITLGDLSADTQIWVALYYLGPDGKWSPSGGEGGYGHLHYGNSARLANPFLSEGGAYESFSLSSDHQFAINTSTVEADRPGWAYVGLTQFYDIVGSVVVHWSLVGPPVIYMPQLVDAGTEVSVIGSLVPPKDPAGTTDVLIRTFYTAAADAASATTVPAFTADEDGSANTYSHLCWEFSGAGDVRWVRFPVLPYADVFYFLNQLPFTWATDLTTTFYYSTAFSEDGGGIVELNAVENSAGQVGWTIPTDGYPPNTRWVYVSLKLNSPGSRTIYTAGAGSSTLSTFVSPVTGRTGVAILRTLDYALGGIELAPDVSDDGAVLSGIADWHPMFGVTDPDAPPARDGYDPTDLYWSQSWHKLHLPAGAYTIWDDLTDVDNGASSQVDRRDFGGATVLGIYKGPADAGYGDLEPLSIYGTELDNLGSSAWSSFVLPAAGWVYIQHSIEQAYGATIASIWSENSNTPVWRSWPIGMHWLPATAHIAGATAVSITPPRPAPDTVVGRTTVTLGDADHSPDLVAGGTTVWITGVQHAQPTMVQGFTGVSCIGRYIGLVHGVPDPVQGATTVWLVYTPNLANNAPIALGLDLRGELYATAPDSVGVGS